MTTRSASAGSSAIWAAPLITSAMVPGPHMLGMVRATKAIFWLASAPQTGLARGTHAKADEGDDGATGQAQAGMEIRTDQDGGSDEEADAQGGEQIEGGHVDLAANVLTWDMPLLNPSSRVAVVGVDHGQQGQQGEKDDLEEHLGPGQMDGLGEQAGHNGPATRSIRYPQDKPRQCGACWEGSGGLLGVAWRWPRWRSQIQMPSTKTEGGQADHIVGGGPARPLHPEGDQHGVRPPKMA